MINDKRYIIVPTIDVTQAMLENTIPYGINYVQTVVEIEGIDYEVLKWRGDKPVELWNEYPVFNNTEMSDYISTNAIPIPIPPQPI